MSSGAVRLSNLADGVSAMLTRLHLHSLNRLGFAAMRRLVGDDVQVRVDDLDLAGAYAHRRYLMLLAQGRMEPYTAELFKQAVAPGMTVVDVGAFVGYYTLVAARAVGATGLVYALEPDARNHQALLHNLAANGIEDRVRPLAVIAADEEGSLPFHEDKWDPAQSNVSGYRPEAAAYRRPARRLDDVLADEDGVDVVKIDVEGNELAVLRGLEETIERSRERGMTLFIECNATALAAAGESKDSLLGFLEAHGFGFEAIDEEGRGVTRDLGLLDERLYVNLRCTLS